MPEGQSFYLNGVKVVSSTNSDYATTANNATNAQISTNSYRLGGIAASGYQLLIPSSIEKRQATTVTNSIAGTETTVWTITNSAFAAPFTNCMIMFRADVDSSANSRQPTLNVYYSLTPSTTNFIILANTWIVTGNNGNYVGVSGFETIYGITNNIVIIVKQLQRGGNGNSLSRNLELYMEPRQ